MSNDFATFNCEIGLRVELALAQEKVFGFVISMETQLTWYGQSAFKIVTRLGKAFGSSLAHETEFMIRARTNFLR